MPPLSEKLKGYKPKPRRKGPLWEGPSGEGPNGGITFSLLSRFLTCRERFRLYAVEGLRPNETFNNRIEYGNMWHLCEEALASGMESVHGPYWDVALRAYCLDLCRKYPFSQEQIRHWENVCRIQFPVYVDYWKKHEERVEKTCLLQEQVFDVPYTLPSGRVVRLRGKWDGVNQLGKGKNAELRLFETKTKGDVDIAQIQRQLTFDLQTMLYTVALTEGTCPTCRGNWTKEKAAFLDESESSCPNCSGNWTAPFVPANQWKPRKGFPDTPIRGVEYNVVRRPLSGGKGTIRQKQGETSAEYYDRLAQYIEDEPETYFFRFKADITPRDVENFKRKCLNPMLEQLCQWWAWVEQCHRLGDDPFGAGNEIHSTHPMGVRNILDEGGSTDLDAMVMNGDRTGLTEVDTLFRELN